MMNRVRCRSAIRATRSASSLLGAPRPPAEPASRRTLDPGFFDDRAPPLDGGVLGPHLPPKSRSRIGGDGGAHDGGGVITVPVAAMLVLESLFAIEIGWLARC